MGDFEKLKQFKIIFFLAHVGNFCLFCMAFTLGKKANLPSSGFTPAECLAS